MTIKIGINGFGRIGRLILRTSLECPDIEVAAINDPAINVEYICYLIKYDSTHGKFRGEINFIDDIVFINGKSIKVFHQKHPSSIPWQLVNVRYVIEASGMFTTHEKAFGHLANESVRRVIVTAPSSDIPIVILGVNDEAIYSDSRIISNASSTLYCLAPIVKVLEDNFGIQEGFITCIHAMTPSLKPLDGLCIKGKHWRDHRSIHQNIIPTSTGACRTLSKILPHTKDKLTGIAFRVPIVDVSVLDLTVRLETETTLRDIFRAVESAGMNEMRNVIKICKEPTVSSDFIGDSYSCIIDAQSCLQLRPNFYKVVCWYENEYSYACRLVEVLRKYNAKSYPVTSQALSVLRLSKPTEEPKKKNIKTEKVSNITQEAALKKLTPENTKQKPSPSLTPIDNANDSTETIHIWNAEQAKETGMSGWYKENKSKISQDLENIVNKNYNSKTQEKLERIRRDFSRMLNITEGLMKKSLSKSMDLGSRGDVNLSTETKQIMGKLANENDNAPTSGDSVNNKPETLQQNVKKELTINIPRTGNFTMDNSICSYSHDVSHYDIYEKRADLDKSEDSDMRPSQSNNTLNGETVAKITHNDKTVILKSPDSSPKRSQDTSPTKKVIKIESPSFTAKSNSSSVRDSEDNDTSKTPKPNSVTNRATGSSGIPIKKKNRSKDFEKVSTQLELDKRKQNKYIDEVQIDYLKKIFKETLNNGGKKHSKRELPSMSSSNSSNVRVPSSGLDIYDKLESVSVTDSDNSFYVNEKRSQIIEIDELTKSTQDLKRLDNICRIIEISDELSDQLFANIREEKSDMQKKWSFKELCDKIKLDDFCENLLNKNKN